MSNTGQPPGDFTSSAGAPSPSPGASRASVDSLKAAASARADSPRPPAPPLLCGGCQRALARERSFRGPFTLCEVASNAEEFHRDFIWLHAKKRVFRVPRAWAETEHPGGGGALTKGGCDANEAFFFHNEAGRAVWAKFEVGWLVPCPGAKPRAQCAVV